MDRNPIGFSNANDKETIIRAIYIVHNGIRIASEFVPETFGRLTTIGPKFKLRGHFYQVCQCLCNLNECTVARVDLLHNGKTKSCGCDSRSPLTTHGKSKTREYAIWKAIKARCGNPNVRAYRDYGARGIGVCARWQEPVHGFSNFYADMGPRPGPEYSINRKNNDGNYCPENCVWATDKEQARNTRRNVMLTAFGKTQCMSAWAEEYGIPYRILMKRVRDNWVMEDAVKHG